MPTLKYGGREITLEIIPADRKKSLGIRVVLPSRVIVRSPRSMKEAEVIRLARARLPWVEKKLRELETVEKNGEYQREFVSGESFPYLGRNYRLKILRSSGESPAGCLLTGGRLTVTVSTGVDVARRTFMVKQALLGWYRARAAEKLRERMSHYAELVGRAPAEVRLRNQKKRWGSCSSKGILYLNWKIVMAPLSIVDYVVVHELCHLVEHGHSPNFWSRMEVILPDYRKRKTWLKGNSSLLNIIPS